MVLRSYDLMMCTFTSAQIDDGLVVLWRLASLDDIVPKLCQSIWSWRGIGDLAIVLQGEELEHLCFWRLQHIDGPEVQNSAGVKVSNNISSLIGLINAQGREGMRELSHDSRVVRAFEAERTIRQLYAQVPCPSPR